MKKKDFDKLIDDFYNKLWELHQTGELEYPDDDNKAMRIINEIDNAYGR